MPHREKPSFTSVPARRRPALGFSLTGLFYCLTLLFMGFAAMNTQANLLFGVFGLMIGILIVSGALSRIVLRKMSLHRTLPEHVFAGEPMTFFYELSNRKRLWPSLSLTVAELDGGGAFDRQSGCYMLHAAPGMTASVPTEVIPRRRGVVEFDQYQLITSFPFGFVKRAVVNSCKDVLCIYPALAEIHPRLWDMCRSADALGESTRPRSGGDDEFYGVREFRAGDNPRHIYWRRSARTGVLVSREMTRASPPKIMVLLDTFAPDPSPVAIALVERTIAMAASMVWVGLRREFAVGLAVWSDRPIEVRPARGKQHRDEVMGLLARLGSNAEYDAGKLLAGRDCMRRSGTTLALLTPGLGGAALAPAPMRGMLVLSASDPATASLFSFRPGVTFDRGHGRIAHDARSDRVVGHV